MSAYAACESRRGNLLADHVHLVKRIAHHLKGRMPDSVQIDDLVQAGMVGLLEAHESYDASKGASFETFASIRVRGAMLDEVRRGDWTPRSVHKNTRRLDAAIRGAQARLGRVPGDREIAAELGISMDEYFAMLRDSVGHKLVSYEETLENGDAGDPGGGHEVSVLFESAAFGDELADAIANLPEREQLILSLYYDRELNLKEIGQVIGVGESRVSQLMSQATARLRVHLKEWIDES